MHGARSNHVKQRENTRILCQQLPIPSAKRGPSLNRVANHISNSNAKDKEHYNNNNNNNNKDVHSIVRLPKLQKRTEEPFISELTLATQELRRTMMRQTGGMYNDTFSNTDMGSALDTLLGTGTIHAEATETWRITQTLQNISAAFSLGGTNDAGVIMNALSTTSPTAIPLTTTTTTTTTNANAIPPISNTITNTVMGETIKQNMERPVLAITMTDVPWYKPPLKLQLLQQCCCYPDDTYLFRHYGVRKFSTASIFSNSSSLQSSGSSSSSSSSSSLSSSPSSFSPSEKNKKQKQQHGNGKEGNNNKNKNKNRNKKKPVEYTKRKPVRQDLQVLASRERSRHMRAQRFTNALNSWCTVVSRVPLAERDNPSELHETCMIRIYKEEESLFLAKSLLRHQAMQQRERHRQKRQMEEERKARDEVAHHERMVKQNRWKGLLCTWTTMEEGKEEEKGEVKDILTIQQQQQEHKEEKEEEEQQQQEKFAKEECLVTSQLLQLVPPSTNALAIQQSIAQRILTSAGPSEKRLVGKRETGGNNNNNNIVQRKSRSSISPKKNNLCNPLQELHILTDQIARSYKGVISDVKKSADIKVHFYKVFDAFRQFREGILFAPSSSVYREINWVERVIQNDDFVTLKEITQEIIKYIYANETQTNGVMSPSQHQQQQRSSLFLLERYTKNNVGSLVTVDSTAIPPNQMLFPLRLHFDSRGGRVRVVTVDGLTLSGISQSPRKCSIPSSSLQGTANNNNNSSSNSRGNVNDKKANQITSYVDNTNVEEEDTSAISPFDLHTFLSSTTDILGEPPRRYEILVAYTIDTTAIVRQSQWRATVMKQLANEESVEVRRCILARVLVALSIHTVFSRQEQVRIKTVSPSVTAVSTAPSLEREGEEREENVRSQKTSISLSVSPPLLLQENEQQQQHQHHHQSEEHQQHQQQQQQQVINHESILAAPTQRNHYVLDVHQLYFVAASALMENNDKLLPSLQRLRVQYRRLAADLLKNSEGYQGGDFTNPSDFSFTQKDADTVGEQLSSVIRLLQLEASYSEQLAALHRNECAVLHYNYHVSPYREFLRAEQALWAPLYLRTLRLAHTFCVLLLQLGTLPIPPRYRPFLGPVLQLLNCHGGQKELRRRIDECLLELEERGKRVRMPLLSREVQGSAQMELDAAADAVQAGYCSAEQIITCLAVPEDVVGTEPELLTLPTMLFVDVPPITGNSSVISVMRIPSTGCSTTTSTSLRRDVERFIHPLAQSLRQNNPAARAAIARSSNSFNKQTELCKRVSGLNVGLYGRSPGIRESVTYFSTRMNALLNRPLEYLNNVEVTMPLYRCPICCSVTPPSGPQPPWMTPLEITRHMSWLHAFNGSTQSSFTEYNKREMKRLFKSLPSSAHSQDVVKTMLPIARIVVMLDVANIELSTEDVLYELLCSEESIRFFRRVPCAFVCVHEVFIPHTSRPGHIFFQLSRLHPHSDMFTVYAATRSESGDLVSAAIMGELLLENKRGCGPPIVLLTKDRVQKMCVAETFGGIVGKGGRVFLPRMTTAGILSSLREANNASMG